MSDASVSAVDGRAVVVVGGSELIDPFVGQANTAADEAQDSANAAQLAAATALASGRYFATKAAGESGSTTGQLFSTDDGAGNLIYYRKLASGSQEVGRAVTPAFLASADGAGRIGFQADGTGAVARTAKQKLQDRVSVFDYGAIGNGTTDDTAAIKRALSALRSGGTLEIGNGYSFLLSESLVIAKPVRIVGSTMDMSKLIFSASGSYTDIGNGTRALVIITHTLTGVSGSGYAARTSFHGFCVSAQANMPANVRGIVICAPSYLTEVRVENCTSDGFAVMAGPESPINGNANGTVLTNCASQANGRNGYYFVGNDANACLINRCFSADCTLWGFYDDSLLGNTYIACEADNNKSGGYYANPAKPQASTYLGCYSETPPFFKVGPLCQLWGAQGLTQPSRATGGVTVRGLPVGAAYLSQPLRIALTDAIANALGDSSAPGSAVLLSERGLEIRFAAGEGVTRLVDDYDPDYVSFAPAGVMALNFPKKQKVGNLSPGRMWALQGIVFGGAGAAAIVGSGNGPPTSGSYAAGGIWLNDAPTRGGWIGWSCITGGSPGTWVGFGAIAT